MSRTTVLADEVLLEERDQSGLVLSDLPGVEPAVL